MQGADNSRIFEGRLYDEVPTHIVRRYKGWKQVTSWIQTFTFSLPPPVQVYNSN